MGDMGDMYRDWDKIKKARKKAAPIGSERFRMKNKTKLHHWGRVQRVVKHECIWVKQDDCNDYSLGCGSYISWDYDSDCGPEEAGYKFCHHCGKRIKFV